MIEPGAFPFEWLWIALYAETHYRFRYFLSYLRKNEPEIIADAPFRIEPGSPIPLLILVKDAHEYPCVLKGITVRIRPQNPGSPRAAGKSFNPLVHPRKLDSRFWWKVYLFPTKDLDGWVELDVEFEIEVNGRIRKYRNDNHRTSSRKSLRVFVARDPLPRLKTVHFGDIHTHSNYTDDQVEFGAPLEASVLLSKSLGLSFFGATDHSYDLDDRPDDYLKNDPTFPKWRRMQSEIDNLARKHRAFAILRGEEASCRSSGGHNVHLVLLGNRDFVEGSGDGAEKWFRTWCEHSVLEITSAKDSGTLAIAAHPVEDVPFLQRLLLRRGIWLHRDVAAGGLTGVQFANGSRVRGFQRGVRQWVKALLEGRRLFAVAGNDAHGNFNRFRQLGIPFLVIRETREHMFGGMRTGVFLNGLPSEKALLRVISDGLCVITDGPIAKILARTGGRKAAQMGGRIVGGDIEISVEALSSAEFGRLESVVLFQGVYGEKEERVLLSEVTGEFEYNRLLRHTFDKPCYVRLEAWTSASNDFDGERHFCFTNPIWIAKE